MLDEDEIRLVRAAGRYIEKVMEAVVVATDPKTPRATRDSIRKMLLASGRALERLSG